MRFLSISLLAVLYSAGCRAVVNSRPLSGAPSNRRLNAVDPVDSGEGVMAAPSCADAAAYTVFDGGPAERRCVAALSNDRDRMALVALATDVARERAHGFRLLALGCDSFLREHARRTVASAGRIRAPAASEEEEEESTQ